MACSPVVVLERTLGLLGVAGMTLGIIYMVKGNAYYVYRPPPFNYFLLGVLSLAAGFILFVIVFILCCWRLNSCKCRTTSTDDKITQDSIEKEAWSLINQLQDDDLVFWIQQDEKLGPEFKGLISDILYNPIEKQKEQEAQESEGSDPWVRQSDLGAPAPEYRSTEQMRDIDQLRCTMEDEVTRV